MDIWSLHALVPPKKVQPDFERFHAAITTTEKNPVPVGDLFADPQIMEAFLGEKVRRPDRAAAGNPAEIEKIMQQAVAFLDQSVRFSREAGWDFVTSHSVLGFPGFRFNLASEASKDLVGGRRAYIDSNRGPIMTWEDFENYQWPESPGIINAGSKFLAGIVPPGMKILVLPGGLFEWTTWLMGLVPFSYALYDQPDLVDAVTEKLARIIYRGAEELMSIPEIGGLFIGDDMGFYSGTLVQPDIIRDKFLPHLKRMVDLAHQAGKLAILHSCGNLEAIMADICDTGVDAKHSFEDKIMPVEEAYRRWGSRTGMIGGVDVDLLAGSGEDQVRQRTREILDACGPGGRYVLGSGNSVASYIPLQNYLVMLDEGRRWNMDHYGREI